MVKWRDDDSMRLNYQGHFHCMSLILRITEIGTQSEKPSLLLLIGNGQRQMPFSFGAFSFDCCVYSGTCV